MTRLPNFTNRATAGKQLAASLGRFAGDDTVVVGLTRGGVPVAAEVARALGSTWDLLVVRKIGAPFQPELGIGALAEGAVQVIDTVLCQRLGITDADVRRLVRETALELDSRTSVLRRNHARRDLTGRLVIVVDDGLATGSTAHAAIRSARRAGARYVVLATPVGSPEAVRRLEGLADEVVCLVTPEDFMAVGYHYEDFGQVSDSEVMRCLDEAGGSDVVIRDGGTSLAGILDVPTGARVLIVFAHGSGSSRLSPRNRQVARALNEAGLATLLMDLLTVEEAEHRSEVFDIERLADRLETALIWSRKDPRTRHLALALFGASTGAAAALVAAARRPEWVRSVVSRGGRPDLATPWLSRVAAPTLLIVGGDDVDVLRLNREALSRLHCPASLEVIPGASHLFEEPGTLERVAALAGAWFTTTVLSRAA